MALVKLIYIGILSNKTISGSCVKINDKIMTLSIETRKVWRYQRGNQNPLIEGGQTMQWSKDKKTIWQTTIYQKKLLYTEN
jgi:hypothetical protein